MSVTKRMPQALEQALRLFAALVILCAAIELVCARALHLGWPYNFPTPMWLKPFDDFRQFIFRFHHFGTPQFVYAKGISFTYPATSSAILAPFYAMPHPTAIYLGSMLFSFAVCGVLLARALRNEGVSMRDVAAVVVAYAFAYPLWFVFGQANSEFLIWAFATLGLWFFWRDRTLLAALCISTAGAMKMVPFILLGLIFARRRYRDFALGVLFAVLLHAVSLKLETGSIVTSLHGNAASLQDFHDGMMLRPYVFYDHSIFGMIKTFVFVLRHGLVGFHAAEWMERIYLLAAGITALVLFFTRIRLLPTINQILLLCLSCVLLPPVSFDYTLLYLLYPCALLIVCAIRSAPALPAGLQTALLLTAVIMAPETELTVRGRTLSSLIKVVSLLWLFVVALRHPFPLQAAEPKLDATAAAA